MSISKQDNQLRRSLAAAMRQPDAGASRRAIVALTDYRFAAQLDGNPFVRRFWQVVTTYSEAVPADSVPDRATAWRLARKSCAQSGPVAALLDLQAWAKPRRYFQQLVDYGLADMTCEFIIVECAEHFPAEVVARTRRLLVEHDLTLPSRR